MELQTTLPDGFRYLPSYFDKSEQEALVETLRAIIAEAPLFRPKMPRTGRPFSVQMSNCGSLGWVSDVKGYRYQEHHPVTGHDWPIIPEKLVKLWNKVASYHLPPEACLINFYDKEAKMGLHQDKDEDDLEAPVVSISLGDTAVFRIGGKERGGSTQSLKLQSGDVVILGGDSRMCFHGIDRIYHGTSQLLRSGGRLNLTMRRVTHLCN